jgi:hypothetical protein
MVNYRKEPQEIFVQMDVEYMPGKVGNDAMQFTLAATGKLLLVLLSCEEVTDWMIRMLIPNPILQTTKEYFW